MPAEFVWERFKCPPFGRVWYRNLVSGEERQNPPLPGGWDVRVAANGKKVYIDLENKVHSFRHPCDYAENPTLTGLPWLDPRTNRGGDLEYYNVYLQRWSLEPDIALPRGWVRGTTYNGRLFYFHEDQQEFSYLLPGQGERALDTQSDLQHVKERLEDLTYHLHNREVITRCGRAIVWSLVKTFNLELSIQKNLPDQPLVNWIRLDQLLKIVGEENLAPQGMDDGLLARLEEASSVFFELKALSHEVVHQQILTRGDLDATMNDLYEKLRNLRDEVSEGDCQEATRQQFESYLGSLRWLHSNYAWYLQRGDIAWLKKCTVLFPFRQFYGGGQAS